MVSALAFFCSGVLFEVLESPLVSELAEVFFSILAMPPDLGGPCFWLGAGEGDFLGSIDAPIF
jgi:hypothetical protein